VAAKSMASGMPSRRRQIAAIVARSSPCGEKSDCTDLVVAMKKLHRAVSGYVCGFLMLGRHIQRRNTVNVLALACSGSPGSWPEWSLVGTCV